MGLFFNLRFQLISSSSVEHFQSISLLLNKVENLYLYLFNKVALLVRPT